MTKAELVNLIYEKMKETSEKQDKAKTTREWMDLSNNNYEECKKIGIQNGCVGQCFDMLWEKARVKIAREQGIYPDSPSYVKV